MKRTDQFIICSLLGVIQLIVPGYAWTWSCVDRRCVRSESPVPESALGSLDVCRLTCGQYGAIWPQPTGHTAISDKVIYFDPTKVSFDFTAVTEYSRSSVKEFMSGVSQVFVGSLGQICGKNCSQIPETSVTVFLATSSGDMTLNWLTDESYSLDVATRANQVTVHIQAETVYGARHGLETLSQLVTRALEGQLVMVTTAKVSDKPVYPHRGLLLDTARNFLPLSAIKRSIDAMASCKLNVLHWHATDSQSFPLYMPSTPQLTRFGAYSAEEIYKPEDVDMLIKYARVRGVRVIMELDMPAHAGNGWQFGPEAGLGQLAVCVNQQPWRQSCLQPPCGQLNPANPALYRILRDVFQDIVDRIPAGEAFHMGGDEVYFPCWNQSKEVTDWMKSLGLGLSETDFFTVWGEFHKKVLQVWDQVVGNSKTPVLLWSSHLTDPAIIGKYLDKDRFVIQAWIDSFDPTANKLMEMGYRIIMVTKDAWYLDHGFWGRTRYYNWKRVYDNHLSQNRNMLGGEVAMWGELVDDNNLDSRVWPRATAAAERLWSDPVTTSTSAEDRLITQRDRLVWRGVHPEAVTPQWCAHNPGLCIGSANIS